MNHLRELVRARFFAHVIGLLPGVIRDLRQCSAMASRWPHGIPLALSEAEL